uniref:SFRICE_022156 n=1 Tax=Spodoptera frugiperda TaxID=7108 RepID=A0A2H1WY43_SPOFR
MSKKLASKSYNVPRGTIQSRLRKPCKDLPGPRPVLSTEEEEVLVQWVVDCCRKGFPKRKSDLQLSVASFLKKSGRENPFKDDIPGKKWYDLFMRRHPELSERTAEAVTSASANVSEKDIKGWFHKIELYLKENHYFDILQDPARVFNGDESNFQLCPKSGKVISLRGERDVYEVDHATAKTSLTVQFTFCANGDVTPPLVVFPNKRLPKDITSSVPDEWGIGLSDTGWMKSELFYDYIKNVFHPYLYKIKVTFPVILFVDGHKTHLSLEVSELCSKLQIVLIALYPNATRILQPADVSAFRPLKTAWKESVLKWRRDYPLETLTKNNFVPVLKEALEVGIKDTTIINGFRTTGLCPWNSDAINYNKCLNKGSKHDEEPKEDNLKRQDNSNKEKVMTREVFENIVGQEKITFLQRIPLENLTETESILKKICCFFENQEADTSTSKENYNEIENFTAVGFQDIAQLPVIAADDFVDDIQATTTITNEQYYNNTGDCLDSQQYLLTPVKLQDILITVKTPERKGVKNIERSSFVLTSAEWKKTENNKLKAKKLKEEEQETRKKNRLLKQDEKNKTIEPTRNKINKKAKGTIETKKQETEANLIQET